MRRRRAGLPALLLAALVAALPATAAGTGGPAAAATTTAATSLRPAGKFAPAGGVLLGAYVNLTGTRLSDADAMAGVASRETLLNHRMDVDNHYYSWGQSFPTPLEADDAAKGRIPLVSWAGTSLDGILSGSQDAYIDARAAAVKAYGSPVLLRWSWEMNGSWSVGGGYQNNTPGTTDGPAKYVAAWRRIHDRFAASGVTNVAWVWCPNGNDVPSDAWNHWTAYYPGDAYVDWVGVDAYNWGTYRTPDGWHSFATGISPVYSDYATRKPFIVAETASAEDGGDKGAWIVQMQADIKAMYPALAALVWFDQFKETDWHVDSSPGSLTAYQALAADPYFRTSYVPVPAPTPPALQPVDNPPAAGRVAGPLVPAGGALLGVQALPAGTTSAQTRVVQLEKEANRTLDIDHRDYSWSAAFPGPGESWDLQNGRIPMITWRPDDIPLDGLAKGWNDWRVHEWAKILRGLQGKVFLRFAPSMNNATNTYSGVNAGSSATATDGPARYVAAWRHVHDVMVADGATNVVWVWAPDAADAAGTPAWNHWTAYYPGDAYVDWVGVNAVNHGTPWQATTPMVTPVYNDYRTRKPVMVAETASVEAGGSKALWLNGAAGTLPANFPDVAAYVYADRAGTEPLQLDSSASAYAAWVSLAQTPYFRPRH